MQYATDYRRAARNALAGMWGRSLAVTLVAVLLGGFYQSGITLNLDANGLSLGFGSMDEVNLTAFFQQLDLAGLARWGWPVQGFVLLMNLALFIMGGAVELGHDAYYLSLVGGGRPEFNELFSRFSVFLKALGLRLFRNLFIFLWALLLVIPGIVAFYRYRLAPYLMAQDPGMGIREAVDESKRRTYGHKARWFWLDMSFIGWALLCILTLGIGFLWLNPYIAATQAAFARELMGGAWEYGRAQEPAFDYRGPERL